MANITFIVVSIVIMALTLIFLVNSKKPDNGSSPEAQTPEKVQQLVEYTRSDGQKVTLLVDFQHTENGWKMTKMRPVVK